MGLGVTVRVQPRRQRQGPHRQILLGEQREGPLHGPGPGRVAVIDQHHLVRQGLQQPHLLPGEGRAQGGQDVRHAVHLEGDEVEIALHHQGHAGGPQGLGGLGQPVEGAPLGVQQTLRRVEVLGFAVADGPAAEGDDPALPVEDGEHDAAPEAVIKAAPVPGHQEAHLLGQVQGDAPVLEVPPQRVPLIHGIAQLKGPDDLRGEAPFFR